MKLAQCVTDAKQEQDIKAVKDQLACARASITEMNSKFTKEIVSIKESMDINKTECDKEFKELREENVQQSIDINVIREGHQEDKVALEEEIKKVREEVEANRAKFDQEDK